MGADASELAQEASELSITGDDDAAPPPARPARPATGLEEWQAAAQAQQEGTPEHVDAEMAGVPAGVRVDELPEMVGVPVSGPQQVDAEGVEVRGAGARIGAAEGLINALERGIAPQ